MREKKNAKKEKVLNTTTLKHTHMHIHTATHTGAPQHFKHHGRRKRKKNFRKQQTQSRAPNS